MNGIEPLMIARFMEHRPSTDQSCESLVAAADMHPITLRYRPAQVEAYLVGAEYRRLMLVQLAICATLAGVDFVYSVFGLAFASLLLFLSRCVASCTARVELGRSIGVGSHCVVWLLYFGSWHKFGWQAEAGHRFLCGSSVLFAVQLHLFTIPAEIRCLFLSLMAFHLAGQIQDLACLCPGIVACHCVERHHRGKLLHTYREDLLAVARRAIVLVPRGAEGSAPIHNGGNVSGSQPLAASSVDTPLNATEE